MSLADLQFVAQGNVLVARVIGELDVSNAEDIGSTIVQSGVDDASGVVLDMTELQFVDSVGICVILGLRDRLLRRGGGLALVIPERSPTYRTVRLVSVTPSLTITEKVEHAVRILTGGETRRVV